VTLINKIFSSNQNNLDCCRLFVCGVSVLLVFVARMREAQREREQQDPAEFGEVGVPKGDRSHAVARARQLGLL
jgi:hypothetical protein